MQDLTNILLSEKDKDPSKQAFFTVDQNAYFHISLDGDDPEKYRLQGSIWEESGKFTKEESVPFMADFLRMFTPGKIESSELYINLGNNQRMEIQHKFIREFNLNHYEVSFHSQGRTDQMKVFAAVAESIYGIEFNRECDLDSRTPFNTSNDKSTGIVIEIRSGLLHGTHQEKEAFEIMQRLRISDTDRRKLGSYNPALVTEQPETNYVRGTVIQEAGTTCGRKFLSLMKELPVEIESLHIELSETEADGDRSISLGNQARGDIPFGRVPDLGFILLPRTKSEFSTDVNKIWDMYHRISGTSLQEAIANRLSHD